MKIIPIILLQINKFLSEFTLFQQIVYIPEKVIYCLENKYQENLVIVEVQIGNFFEEDNIKNYNNYFR